jgi:predicted MPP superfamily phosphohydrolase
MGYQQQKGYPDKLPAILAALSTYLSAREDIDFVLHGGDMIDVTTDDRIAAAARAFDLSIPVYLCLGNHDLTAPDAVDRWLTLAPQFFPNGSPDYTIASDDCVLHIAPNQ